MALRSLHWPPLATALTARAGHLRQQPDFHDVTLVCEDNQLVPAHKVILSAGSSFFRSVLGQHLHPHPLIYLRGVGGAEVGHLLDLLYTGEARVEEHLLPSLLTTATNLGVEGLEDTQLETTKTVEDEDIVEDDDSVPTLPNDVELEELEAANVIIEYEDVMDENLLPTDSNTDGDNKGEGNPNTNVSEEAIEDDSDAIIKKYSGKLKAASIEETESLVIDEKERQTETIDTLETDEVRNNDVLETEVEFIDREVPENDIPIKFTPPARERQPRDRNDLETVLEGMVERLAAGLWQCKHCARQYRSAGHAKEHAESHVKGIKYSCGVCGRSYKSSASLRSHRSQQNHYSDMKRPRLA